MASASASPWDPVHALAPPELMTTARPDPPTSRARETCTGAAATLLRVKTPATADGWVETIRATSGLPVLFRPALTPAARKPWAAQTPPVTVARLMETGVCRSDPFLRA